MIEESKATLSATILTEIGYTRQAFRELTGELLREIADFSELESFEEEMSERFAFIHSKYGGKLETLFKSKVVVHLPAIASRLAELGDKLKGII